MSLKIGVIIASNRPTRLGPKIANWFMDQVKDAPNVEWQLIDLAEVNLPWLDEPKLPSQGGYEHEHTKKWAAIIEPLDGFVIVSPEYNHGYPAALKNALDTIYAEWARKPVGFVMYGALGGVSAMEQLIGVCVQLGMMPLSSKSLRIIETWGLIDDDGNVNEGNIKGSLEALLDSLVWWGEALKKARAAAN